MVVVEVRRALAQGVNGQFIRIGFATAARNGHAPFFAVENSAAHRRFVTRLHQHAVGITEKYFWHRANLVASFFRLGLRVSGRIELAAFGPDFDRPGFVHTEGALNLIVTVRTPTRHLTAGIRPERKPAGIRARQVEVLVERHFGIRSAPHFPVQFIRHGLGRQVAFPRAGVIVGNHFRDLAEAAVANEFTAGEVLPLRTLLAADLEDAVVFARRLHDQSPLANGERHRLLGVNILSRLAGHDADVQPPMLRRRRDNGVHVLAFEQLPKILERRGVVLRRRFARALQVHVCNGHVTKLRQPQQALQESACLPANADEADADFIVGPGPACGGQNAAGENLRERGAGNQSAAPFQKCSPRKTRSLVRCSLGRFHIHHGRPTECPELRRKFAPGHSEFQAIIPGIPAQITGQVLS